MYDPSIYRGDPVVDVTLIGTGALQPLPERALASAAITCGGRVLLLDCGEGTQAAARRAGVSLMKIDVIALTHYHGDHTYGLPGLWQSMAMAGRTEPVCVLGPKGLHEAMKPFMMLCPHLPFELRFVEPAPEGMALGGLIPGWPEGTVITPFATHHRVPSQCYRFDLLRAGRFLPEKAKALGVPVALWNALQHGEAVQVEDKTVLPEQVMSAPRRGISAVYTGDTALCASMAQAAEDADILICEATYGEDAQEALALEHGHMTFAQAAQLAAEAKAHELWLTHYSPMITDPQEHVVSAKAYFVQVVCGTDGMTKTLRFDKNPNIREKSVI